MEKTTLEKFFAGKNLVIPRYQRDYAWERANVDDLWNDIGETIALSSPHYLGTFILAKKRESDQYEIVDGQQRLVTLTMILSALVQKLGSAKEKEKVIAQARYLEEKGRKRVTLIGDNQPFFEELLAGKKPDPKTRGQKRLRHGFQRIQERVDELASRDANAVEEWIDEIGRLSVLEFVEDDEGNAIRIFETVNDRGRALSVIDKVKSFLIYVSNRYLKGELDSVIQERFGRIFQSFDQTKEVGERLRVELIQRKQFAEDSVLLYHFLAYPSEFHDYQFSAEDVLDLFLKLAVKKRIASKKLEDLKRFVDDYSEDLARFFEGLGNLLRRAESEPYYFKLFTSLPLSAELYPLTIRLEVMGLLSKPLPSDHARTFLDAIETTDLRVYKTRGTHPQKDVASLARDAAGLKPDAIAERLKEFLQRFMSDAEFKVYLSGSVYQDNEGTRHILLEFDEKTRRDTTGSPATIGDLAGLWNKEPTIDHVLAQQPGFAPEGRGFKDDVDFLRALHRLGNLVLVERALNSAARNKTPEQKSTEDRLYKNSVYPSARKLAAEVAAAVQSGKQFNAANVQNRTQELVDFCSTRWPIW